METQRTYCKARSFKDFNHSNCSQDLLNHHLNVQNLYEHDPDIIADNLTAMLQQCLDYQAPVTITQISKKATQNLSVEAREKLTERDTAHQVFKITNNSDNLRHFKNL